MPLIKSTTKIDQVLPIFDRPHPPTLYHYTNGPGLIGIIQNSEIWSTHTQYLNDSQEFRHALALFSAAIKEKEKQQTISRSVSRKLIDICDGIERLNVCVTSFSEDRDSLSQWRAYGSAPGSFAVGFDADALDAIAMSFGASLVPCIYDEAKQNIVVAQTIELIIEKPESAWLLLCRICPLLKHPAFSAEREWRIVTPPMSAGDSRFAFRAGASMLIPYYRISLSEKPEELPLHELMIGPTPNPKQSEHSAMLFLAKYELAHKPISHSTAPYRSW